MKIARRVVLGLAIVLVLLIVAAFFMPRHATVSRSVEIAAPASVVFPMVGDLRRFNEWSPWFARDPAAVYTFTGPTDGVDQTMNWTSKDPDVGAGSMTVERIEPEKVVVMAIAFAGEGDAQATITLESTGALTRVVWRFDSDLGFNPIARYFGLMMDGRVGPDYERGLARLKTVAEAATPSGEAGPSSRPADASGPSQ